MKKLAFVILSFSVMIFMSGCATLQDSHTNHDSIAISNEWKLLEFLSSDENINKRSEYENCYATNGKDSAICEKILDSWRESCERGEEKYCIGILAIHSKTDYGNYFIFDSLGAVKRNCDSGMVGSCHAVGEYYYDIYLDDKKASSMLKSAWLYLQKACDLDMAVSCSFVAQMYKYGHFQEGTAEQVAIYEGANKARGIADKDCKAGVKMACDFKEILAEKKSVLVLLLHW